MLVTRTMFQLISWVELMGLKIQCKESCSPYNRKLVRYDRVTYGFESINPQDGYKNVYGVRLAGSKNTSLFIFAHGTLHAEIKRYQSLFDRCSIPCGSIWLSGNISHGVFSLPCAS